MFAKILASIQSVVALLNLLSQIVAEVGGIDNVRKAAAELHQHNESTKRGFPTKIGDGTFLAALIAALAKYGPTLIPIIVSLFGEQQPTPVAPSSQST